jgi:hypothetical protein
MRIVCFGLVLESFMKHLKQLSFVVVDDIALLDSTNNATSTATPTNDNNDHNVAEIADDDLNDDVSGAMYRVAIEPWMFATVSFFFFFCQCIRFHIFVRSALTLCDFLCLFVLSVHRHRCSFHWCKQYFLIHSILLLPHFLQHRNIATERRCDQ